MKNHSVTASVLLTAIICSRAGAAPVDSKSWLDRLQRDYASEVTADAYLARMAGMSDALLKDEIIPWANDVDRRLAGDGEAAGAIARLVRFPPQWKESTFLAEEFRPRATRTRALSPASVSTWAAAIERVEGSAVSTAAVVLFVTNLPELFASGRYDTDAAARSLARLAALPLPYIAEFASALGCSKAEAAMRMVSADFAFDASAFRKQIFDETIRPVLRSMASSRK